MDAVYARPDDEDCDVSSPDLIQLSVCEAIAPEIPGELCTPTAGNYRGVLMRLVCPW